LEKQFSSARLLLSTAQLERWPQVCRVKITFTELPTNRFVSTTQNSMKCVVNWIPLRVRGHSKNTQPQAGLDHDFVQTNVRIQWSPVYKAFHRIHSCGNETKCQYQFKRDLDAANLR